MNFDTDHSTESENSGDPDSTGDPDPTPFPGRSGANIRVRRTRPEDFAALEQLSRLVYPDDLPWTASYLAAHRRHFAEGQLVAEDARAGEVVGMAASLIVDWDDYDRLDSYWNMTEGGTFANHDPSGRTLYGAEVMVDPRRRRQGIGRVLYAARRELARRFGCKRIRAGARLPGYDRYAHEMTCHEYAEYVVRGELSDPTLSFQLSEGFRVLAVVPGYMRGDQQSHGYAALIEWLDPAYARDGDASGVRSRRATEGWVPWRRQAPPISARVR